MLNNIKKAVEKLFSNPSNKLINIVNEQIKEIMGHKFGNDEIQESLKQFTIDLSGDLSELTDDKNDSEEEIKKKWTVAEQFKNGKWQNTFTLYKELIKEIKNLGLDIEEKPTKRYIGIVNRSSSNNFLQINGQQSKLRVWLKLELSDLTEEEKLKTRDVTNIGHWGMGNIELLINNKADFIIAFQLIKKAFDKK